MGEAKNSFICLIKVFISSLLWAGVSSSKMARYVVFIAALLFVPLVTRGDDSTSGGADASEASAAPASSNVASVPAESQLPRAPRKERHRHEICSRRSRFSLQQPGRR